MDHHSVNFDHHGSNDSHNSHNNGDSHVDVSGGINPHGNHVDGHITGKYTYGDSNSNVHVSGTYGSHDNYNVEVGGSINW